MEARVTRTVAQRVAFAVGVSLVGLMGLPLVFGGLPDPTQAMVWLGLALAVGVCLIPAMVLLVQPLSTLVLRLAGGKLAAPSARRTAVSVARLTVAVVYLVVLQAMVRHPLVAVFGSSVEPFQIEVTVGAAIMVLLIVLLACVHAAVAPLIEGMAQGVLDAAFATSVATEAPQRTSPTSAKVIHDRTVSRNEAEAGTVVSAEHA
jgi:hypothetical protein